MPKYYFEQRDFRGPQLTKSDLFPHGAKSPQPHMTILCPVQSSQIRVHGNHAHILSLSIFLASWTFIYLFIALGNGDVSPDDSQDRSGKGHPHNTDGRGDAGGIVAKVKLGQEETERRGLHRGLNGHGAGGGFAESGGAGEGISDQSTDEVEKEDGDLKAHAGVEDGLGHLGDGTGDEEAGGNDTDDGGEGEDSLDGLGEELVEGHTDSDGGEDDLDGGLGNAGGIDGDDGTEEGLAEEGGHEDGTDGGGGRHEDGQSNVALGNVRAQV